MTTEQLGVIWTQIRIGETNRAIYPEAQKNGFAKAPFEWHGPLNLSLAWFNDVKAINLRKELGGFRGPGLAIAGSDDQDVPLSNLDDIVASAGGKDKAKLLIPGADLTFGVFTGDLTKLNELRDATTNWFLKKLQSRQGPADLRMKGYVWVALFLQAPSMVPTSPRSNRGPDGRLLYFMFARLLADLPNRTAIRNAT